jgi:putative endonuclease
MKKKYYYTYILQSLKTGNWYTGYTGDLRERFKQHNSNQNVSTKKRGPFTLLYYEACLDIEDARARERFLKSGPGKKFLKNRLKRSLLLTGWGPVTGSP